MSRITIATIEEINDILIPIQISLNEIKAQLKGAKPSPQYYRNKDLKKFFGLSENTIIKYRNGNIIPSTKIGDLFFYPVDGINAILKQNSNHHVYDLHCENTKAA